MSRYRRIAQINRAKGLTGEVVAVSAHSLPLHFWQDVELVLVPPQHDLPRACTVLEASALQDENTFIIKLSGINDRTRAQKAIGCFLLVKKEDCPTLDDAPVTTSIGLSVFDQTEGKLGTIVGERIGKAQTIWVVEGNNGEFLIPAAADLIISRDETTITVDLPKGLLELNS